MRYAVESTPIPAGWVLRCTSCRQQRTVHTAIGANRWQAEHICPQALIDQRIHTDAATILRTLTPDPLAVITERHADITEALNHHRRSTAA